MFVLLTACSWSSLDSVFGNYGNKPTDNAKKAPQNEPVGCLFAPGMIALLGDKIKEGLSKRGIESRFAEFASYAGRTLDNTADRRSWSGLPETAD